MIIYQAMCSKFQDKWPAPNSHSINADSSKAGSVQFSSVQSLSHARLSATPWTVAHQDSLPITNFWNLRWVRDLPLMTGRPM